jgi:hypothetical protein
MLFCAFLVARTTAALASPGLGLEAQEPRARPTLIWSGIQLVPSSLLAIDGGRAAYGLRWQVSPLLYSWGVNRKLSGWRALIAEPPVRNSGAVELFLSPELYFFGGTEGALRTGLRATFPLLHRGEYLTASAGLSHVYHRGRHSAAAEAGLHILYGVLGVTASVALTPNAPLDAVVALQVRFF